LFNSLEHAFAKFHHHRNISFVINKPAQNFYRTAVRGILVRITCIGGRIVDITLYYHFLACSVRQLGTANFLTIHSNIRAGLSLHLLSKTYRGDGA